MSETKQIILPITGMTCAHCVVTIERNLKKLDGLQTAGVNLSSERGTIEYDPSVLTLHDIITRIESVGYGVATGKAELAIQDLSNANNAGLLEKSLAKLNGILECQISIDSEKARVKYVPTIISQAEIRRSLREAGFETIEQGGE